MFKICKDIRGNSLWQHKISPKQSIIKSFNFIIKTPTKTKKKEKKFYKSYEHFDMKRIKKRDRVTTNQHLVA